jgi:hypothetical protein
MAEALDIVFRNAWTFCGTCMLIISIGWALAMPFFWWYKLKQLRMARQYWGQDYN